MPAAATAAEDPEITAMFWLRSSMRSSDSFITRMLAVMLFTAALVFSIDETRPGVIVTPSLSISPTDAVTRGSVLLLGCDAAAEARHRTRPPDSGDPEALALQKSEPPRSAGGAVAGSRAVSHQVPDPQPLAMSVLRHHLQYRELHPVAVVGTRR